MGVLTLPGFEAAIARTLQSGAKKAKWRFTLLKDICVYCRAKKARGLDHIHPKSKGGPDGWPNRAPACRSCDMHKGNVSLLIYLYRRHSKEVTNHASSLLQNS